MPYSFGIGSNPIIKVLLEEFFNDGFGKNYFVRPVDKGIKHYVALDDLRCYLYKVRKP